jgi:hypothetical protein
MFHHRKAKSVQGAQFLGVVGKDPDIPNTELAEDLGANAMQAQVRPELSLPIGFVVAGVVRMSPDFISKAGAMPFLAQVDQHAAA